MASTKETTGIGIFAFLVGVAMGAWGVFTTNKKEESKFDIVEFSRWDDESINSSNADKFENVTPNTTTIIDSLENITVNGDVADIVNVKVLGIERAKFVAMWGTKGVNGDDPIKFKRLVDLTTDHLINIKKNSLKVTEDELCIIDSILEDRIAFGEISKEV